MFMNTLWLVGSAQFRQVATARPLATSSSVTCFLLAKILAEGSTISAICATHAQADEAATGTVSGSDGDSSWW